MSEMERKSPIDDYIDAISEFLTDPPELATTLERRLWADVCVMYGMLKALRSKQP